MIAFLDTSAVVKLYIQEVGSAFIREYVQGCSAVLVSAVAYPEGRAALARSHRDGSLDLADYDAAKQGFDADWDRFVVLPAATPTLRLAGDLAERHRLRGFDAVHLASAIVARTVQSSATVDFAAWDARLLAAARAEQFHVVGGTP